MGERKVASRGPGLLGAAKPPGGPDPLIGRVIDERFRIVSLIARGGMGKVYRAEQSPLGRVCALKVLNPNYSGEHDPEFHKRFFLEASIASKLTHPNTVTIFDYGRTDDDIYFMAMEYLEGVTLHRAIREAGSFAEDRAAHIGRQICRALREAHSHGVIHRDLKPANIFLTVHGDEADFVKVLDFGLVKNITGETKPEDQLTQTGLFMGSPKYMAPEQIRGEHVDARTDVYSLGIILYEMLAGKVPFDRTTSLNILMAQVNEEPPPLRTANPATTASAAMEELVARCMAKDPAKRYSTMNDVLLALKRLGGVPAVGTGEHPASVGPPSAVDSGQMSVSKVQQVPAYSTERPHDQAQERALMPSASPGPTPSPMSGNLPLSVPRMNGDLSGDSEIIDFTGGGRRRRKMFGAMVGLVAVATVIGVYATRASSGESSGEPGAATAPIATAPTAAMPATTNVTGPTALAPMTGTPTPPPAPSSAKVRINSEPPGATVKEDGKELCAATPCDHDFDPDPSKDHKLAFTKSGYRAEVRTVHVGDTPVTVRLSKGTSTWSAPPKAQPQPDNTPTPSGFKDIPY
jgi:eukaryotic-like serine/threonine-protein kinase